MENENEIIEDTTDEEILEDVEETDTTDWKAEAEKARGIAQRLKTKLEKANKPKEEKVEKQVPVKTDAEPGGLDETQLDYLDLKGISDQDDIDLIEKVMAKTGQTLREILKDDYVQSKLETNKQARAVKDATPSSTKRGGNQSTDLASAIAKFEASGTLPTDFALASAVVNAIADRGSASKPSWG